MESGWNLWVWLELVSGCCCKEVYRFPQILLIPILLVLALVCSSIPIYTSLFILKMFFHSFAFKVIPSFNQDGHNCMSIQLNAHVTLFVLKLSCL